MAHNDLLTFTDRGIHCPAGGFYIDPWRPVDRALVTHGHSDHARWGHGAYLATHAALPVIRQRLGDIRAEGTGFGQRLQIGDVTVSFHPAGHVPGSAQIRVERAGEVWVVSGDYKTEADGLSEPFEPVACDVFISECTFGLPLFRWEPQAILMARIADWWAETAEAGGIALLGAYGLGKAQRIMAALGAQGPGPICLHGAVATPSDILRAQGYPLPPTIRALPGAVPPGALVIAPPSALGSAWADRLGGPGVAVSAAFASGWMALRGIRRRRGLARGFVMSDHADWPGLQAAIRATGAHRICVTHGYTAPFSRWLTEQGYDARIVATEFEGETAEDTASVAAKDEVVAS